MGFVFLFFIIFHQALFGTFLIPCNETDLDPQEKSTLLNLIFEAEPPRSFFNENPINLEKECAKIISGKPIWIPPTLWQLATLHTFFFDREFRNIILSFRKEPLEFDELTRKIIKKKSNLKEISEQFDRKLNSVEQIKWLFFRANQATYDIYKRAKGSELTMLSLILAELPQLHKWPDFHFPFWDMAYISNPDSIRCFYQALTNETFLNEIIKIEQLAHKNGEWVLYRGFEGNERLSTLEYEKEVNHALSFGSTLLGGTFFSTEATAITYSVPSTSDSQIFLALSVTPQDLKNLFRVGPLHPFLQLLSDGEMFHAHTKIAAKTPFDYLEKPLLGYFMKCNKHLIDKSEYVLSFNFNPQELENAFLNLCKRKGFFKTDENPLFHSFDKRVALK